MRHEKMAKQIALLSGSMEKAQDPVSDGVHGGEHPPDPEGAGGRGLFRGHHARVGAAEGVMGWNSQGWKETDGAAGGREFVLKEG